MLYKISNYKKEFTKMLKAKAFNEFRLKTNKLFEQFEFIF
jgi:hypothetical protein